MKIVMSREQYNSKAHLEFDTGSTINELEQQTVFELAQYLYEPVARASNHRKLLEQLKAELKRK